MADEMEQGTRWDCYVCPDCRHLLRLGGSYREEGLVCPQCRRLLRLAGEEEDAPALTAHAGSEKSRGEIYREERELRREKVFDENFRNKRNVPRVLITAMIGSLALLAVVFGIVLMWPGGESSGEEMSSTAEGIPDEFAAAPSQPAAAEVAEGSSEVVSPAFITEELEPIMLGFLNATSVDEMAEHVRHVEDTRPRMERFYADGFQTPGYQGMAWRRTQRRVDDLVYLYVQDGDYQVRQLTFAQEDDGWKADWESWVGWSEMPWDELRREKPQEPQLVRAYVDPTTYYNFSFREETEWAAYSLTSPDGEISLYGYVERTGELHRQLRSFDGEMQRPFLLKIRYPDNAVSDRQVLITDIIAEEWTDPAGRS